MSAAQSGNCVEWRMGRAAAQQRRAGDGGARGQQPAPLQTCAQLFRQLVLHPDIISESLAVRFNAAGA